MAQKKKNAFHKRVLDLNLATLFLAWNFHFALKVQNDRT
jgi:hypothetical protein